MSVLDLPLDATPDEALLATAIHRVTVKPPRRSRSPRFDGKSRLRRWGVQGRQSMSGWDSHEDNLYDESFGPRSAHRRRPTHEWDDHQAEALVVRLAAADQAQVNVTANTTVLGTCKHCGSDFAVPFRRGPKQQHCNDTCKRLYNNHQVIERYREKQAERLLVAAFGI